MATDELLAWSEADGGSIGHGGAWETSFRASAEVSEVAWVDPTAVGRLNPLNARLLRQAQLI